MGSAAFTLTSDVIDVTEAFQRLVAEEGHRHGYEYSATISAVPGFTTLNTVDRPVTRTRARDIIHRAFNDDNLSKWDPCTALAVGRFANNTPKTLQVITGGDPPELAAVAAQLGVDVGLIDDWKYALRGTPKRSVVVTRPPTSTKVWMVGEPGRGRPYPTKQEAVAAAKAAAAGADGTFPKRIRVWQTHDAASMTVVESRVTKATWDVICQIGSGTFEFSHWLFFGMAPS